MKDQYVFSVWVVADVVSTVKLYLASASFSQKTEGNITIDGTKWYQLFCTFTPTSLDLGDFVLLSTARILYYRDFKLEKGTKPTDWSPAIADTQNLIDSAKLAAQNYAAAQDAVKKVEAAAYADGIVTAEEARAIADANAKLQIAKDDATAKANAAQTAAQNVAAIDAQAKANSSADAVRVLANSYTDSKSQQTISDAKIYADSNATSKANAAQTYAISSAADTAQQKANNAQAAALVAAQTLVNSLKIGARNLFLNSALERSTAGYYLSLGSIDQVLTKNIGKELSISFDFKSSIAGSVLVYCDNYGKARFSYQYIDAITVYKRYSFTALIYSEGSKTSESQFEFYTEGTRGDIFIKNIKIETGNKATDWTPAPEDVDASILLAQTTANNAQSAYNNLTANLKSLAYADVVELAKLGNTVIQGGKLTNTLIDTEYLKANVINAGYINTLELVSKNIKTSATGTKHVEIDGVNNNIRILDAASNILIELDDDSAVEGIRIQPNDYPYPPTVIYNLGPGIRTGNQLDISASLSRKGLLTTRAGRAQHLIGTRINSNVGYVELDCEDDFVLKNIVFQGDAQRRNVRVFLAETYNEQTGNVRILTWEII